MKALEFVAKLGTDASLKVPQEVAARIPREEPVRVIVLLPEGIEDAEWRRLTNGQFVRGYGEGDSIYDAI